MESVKLYMLHPYVHDTASAMRYLQSEFLEEHFNLIWEPSNPEYLITTELIYNNSAIRNQYKRLKDKAKVVIFFTREAVSPDFNLCDYAIGFDSDLSKGDRFVQLPTVFDLYSAFTDVRLNEILSTDDARKELSRKVGFCNFLYSNYMAHPNRDKLFHLLSTYKRVDSLGKHLNNTKMRGTGYKGHESDCVRIKNPYKFSIASENAVFNGYTSEKILTSLVAHTVPIYFGDPDVTRIVNPKCFVNCNEFDRLDDVIEVVRSIDNNDELWCEMVSSPWQTPEQELVSKQRVDKYKQFLFSIFGGGVDNMKRKPEGCRPDMYSYQFFSEKIHNVPLVVRAFRRVMKSYLKK